MYLTGWSWLFLCPGNYGFDCRVPLQHYLAWGSFLCPLTQLLKRVAAGRGRKAGTKGAPSESVLMFSPVKSEDRVSFQHQAFCRNGLWAPDPSLGQSQQTFPCLQPCTREPSIHYHLSSGQQGLRKSFREVQVSPQRKSENIVLNEGEPK